MSTAEVWRITVSYSAVVAPALIVHVECAVVFEDLAEPYCTLVPCTSFAAVEERLRVVDFCPRQKVVGVGDMEACGIIEVFVAALIDHEPFVNAVETEYTCAVNAQRIEVAGASAWLENCGDLSRTERLRIIGDGAVYFQLAVIIAVSVENIILAVVVHCVAASYTVFEHLAF